MSNRATHRAFSLLELLVTVGIIVVLLGILVPSISIAIDEAERVLCLSNIRSQHSAQTTYAFDNKRRFAPHDDFSPDYHRSGNKPNLVTLLRGTYVTSTDILICPITAKVPAQSSNEYRTNDWRANGIFGGWDTEADYTNTAYLWLANFTGTRMFDTVPVPPQESVPDPLKLPGKPSSVQLLNGEPPLARNLGEADQSRSFVTHKINFFLSADSPANLQDVGHGGGGNFQQGTPYDGYKVTEQPVGFGDGHVLTRKRDEIKPRIAIGADYPSNPGSIGTFLW